MDIKRWATDPTREVEGVWHNVGDGAELLIARYGNPRMVALFASLTRPYRRQIENGTLDITKQNELLCRVLADTVLLGWRGLSEDGRPLEYSPAEAYRLLLAYPEFRQMVEDYAHDMEAYREQQIEDAAGN